MSETHEARIAELESQLRSVTDNVGRLMDQVTQKGYLPAFRCGHSGLLLPGDYVKEWGRLYGIGLGIHPVSEVLDSEYEVAPPAVTPEIRRIEQIMHPVRNSCAQVDMVMVSPEELEASAAILDLEDPNMDERMLIVRARQLKNPASRLPAMLASWERIKKGGHV